MRIEEKKELERIRTEIRENLVERIKAKTKNIDLDFILELVDELTTKDMKIAEENIMNEFAPVFLRMHDDASYLDELKKIEIITFKIFKEIPKHEKYLIRGKISLTHESNLLVQLDATHSFSNLDKDVIAKILMNIF